MSSNLFGGKIWSEKGLCLWYVFARKSNKIYISLLWNSTSYRRSITNSTFISINWIFIIPNAKNAPFVVLSSGFLDKQVYLSLYLQWILWGFVLLALAGRISSSSSGKTGTITAVLSLMIGVLLLIFAVKTFFGEDDPDAPPPKIMVMLDKMGPIKLLLAGFLLSSVLLLMTVIF